MAGTPLPANPGGPRLDPRRRLRTAEDRAQTPGERRSGGPGGPPKPLRRAPTKWRGMRSQETPEGEIMGPMRGAESQKKAPSPRKGEGAERREVELPRKKSRN